MIVKKTEFDKVISFQFDDLPVRGRICQTSRSLNKIISQHKYPPEISKLLGETIVLNVLMADSIKLKHKLSLQVHGNKDLKLIASDFIIQPPQKNISFVRGYAKFNKKVKFYSHRVRDLLGDGYFATILDQGDGNLPYKGISNLKGNCLKNSAEEFFKNSEQLDTKFDILIQKVSNKNQKIKFKGIGIMLQLLPYDRKQKDFNKSEKSYKELSDLVKKKIFNNKECWKKISFFFNNYILSKKNNFKDIISDLLLQNFKESNIRIFEEKEFDFGCSCSVDKVKQTMSIYSMKEINLMTNDLGKVTADCQFCGAEYILDPSELGFNN